jgi:hypothetical protein
MIRLNPDPHNGGYVYVPTRAVTAYFPADSDLQPMLHDLVAAGFAENRVDVFTGPRGLERLDPEGRWHGLWVRLMRLLEDTFLEDFDQFKKTEQVLEEGGSVVAVSTLKDADRRRRAAEIMKAHRGWDVIYWGPLVREYL